jgi:F0F1-type ATP synthase membrane subunit c/vacuolar-type H+-ATPase subunit K
MRVMTFVRPQQRPIFSDSSFGPLRLIEALPWLVLAAALRVIAFSGGPVALPAIIVASVAVLQAFIAATRRSIELADGHTDLGDLTLKEEVRLSVRILGRIGLLMIVGTILMAWTGNPALRGALITGLDGMAFDQFTTLGKFWSALVAALVLLMILRAERTGGKVEFFAAVNEFIDRWLWLGGAVVLLGLCYLGLGLAQGIVRDAIWTTWQGETSQPFVRNLMFFVFIFSFAMMRLWLTLFVMTWCLRLSYRYGTS